MDKEELRCYFSQDIIGTPTEHVLLERLQWPECNLWDLIDTSRLKKFWRLFNLCQRTRHWGPMVSCMVSPSLLASDQGLGGQGLWSTHFGWWETFPSPKQGSDYFVTKKYGAIYIKDFRPIIFDHTFAKIFTKVLASCLAPNLNEPIGENQNAFIDGRCIQDNFLMVQQPVCSLHRKKTSTLLLKLDIARAFWHGCMTFPDRDSTFLDLFQDVCFVSPLFYQLSAQKLL